MFVLTPCLGPDCVLPDLCNYELVNDVYKAFDSVDH